LQSWIRESAIITGQTNSWLALLHGVLRSKRNSRRAKEQISENPVSAAADDKTPPEQSNVAANETPVDNADETGADLFEILPEHVKGMFLASQNRRKNHPFVVAWNHTPF
jgi:hypothetical protein